MSYSVERLTATDYDEALSLLNLSFNGENSNKASFEMILPKMWKRDNEHMGKHITCRIDGKMKSIIGIYPLRTKIGTHEFMFCTVGNVATHPDSRGHGYMDQLMRFAIEELGRMHVDAARLSGLRQRYERYGFEPAGTKYTYILTERNMKSCPMVESISNNFHKMISFVQIDMESMELLIKARKLFSRQKFAVVRESLEDFYLSTKAWQMTPWAALDENGEMIGYLVASGNGDTLAEQLVYNDDRFLDMIFAWIVRNGLESVRMDFAPWERKRCRLLGLICENSSVSVASSFLIRSWAEIINALMELKAQQDKMLDGCFVLGIEGYGNISLQVRNGIGSCCREVSKAADFTLTPLTATRLLLGYMPPWAVADMSGIDSNVLNNWLPLPFSWNGQDRV